MSIDWRSVLNAKMTRTVELRQGIIIPQFMIDIQDIKSIVLPT